ncbi:winged helix-turn-helix domain-containing protein [Candidatus Bathyarchaeota archaeon]|jgi:ribosomal protein S25|nr:winged helix-turn-helix domain-containing protein [Candidatus Bathyarchaeota archaeon]
MSLQEYLREKLWPILVKTVHASVMYPNHKAYTRETILQEKPDITASELANRLNMSLGEALVILHELEEERKSPA